MTNDNNKRNNNHSRRNKGISPVLGTIIFVLVAVAAIGTTSFIFMAQDNYNTAVKKTTELVGNKGKEQITAVQLEEAKLQIANDGPATSRIIGLVSADDSTGNLSLKPLNLALPSAQKLDYTIPDSTTGGGLGSGKMGLLTSLGNIFWVDSEPLQNKPLPDFAIAVAPDSLIVEQGKTGTASITVSPLNDFSDAVFLSASGLPHGTSYLIKPSSGNLPYTSTLTVQVGSATPTGVYTITITGDDKNGGVHSATLTLQVNAASNQDFTLSVSSKTVTLQRGSSAATNSVTVSPVNGYDKTVTLETSGFPAGVTYSYNPLGAKPLFTSTLTMGSAANTPAGTYVITVKGSDDTGKVHSDTFTLQITAQPDFDLSVNPSSLNLQSGGSGSSLVSVTSLNGYPGQVSLSLSGLPSGATATFSKPSGNPSFTSVLDINAGTANPGTYNLIVTGTGSIDGKTKSAQLTLAIQETSFDFSLVLDSSNVDVQQGGSGSNTVTISPINGYNKIVSLSASGIPSGVSASFSPQSGVPAFTSTMSISASTSAAPGSYPVTVQAQGEDGKTHSTTFTLKVQAKYQLTISVQTAGPSVAPTTFISDTFGTGLDGWSYWGDSGYSLTRDTGTGSPAPSAKISGDAFATVHGMQKVVDLSSWSKAGTLTLSFNYRAASDYAGSTVTNAFVRIYNADTDQILYEETLVAGGTQDTGWKSYSKDITCSVLSSSSGSNINNKIRIVLFLGDGWSANWNQKNWYDNIKLESSASAATCGGTTSPAPGTYSYLEDESVQVTALPNAGWKLSYWTLDGVSIGSQNPASVTMNKDHALAAVFAQGQSGSDFVVSANPSSLSIAKGSSGSSTVTVNSINGYSSGVSLSLSGLPVGASYSFLPWSSNAPFTSTLTINAGTANAGTYTLSVTGTGVVDGKIRTTTITLTIAPQFDFSLSLNPSSGTVQQGGTSQTTVTTTLLSGTSSTVSLSASGGPLGMTFTFGPASGNPTFASTLTISIPSNAATGIYQITVAGSGGGVSRTATYQLTISSQTTQQPFNYAMSISPSSLSIAKGSSAQTTVSVDLLAGSSAQAVVLSSTGQPSGVAVSFNPSTGNPTFKSTMSISVSSAANAGTYTLTITGTAGALAKSTTLTLTIVNTADFTLSATPGTLTVQQGSTGSTTIKIDALNGYSNIVSLSATGLPSGVTYAFIPSSGKPTFSSTLTLSVSQSAATGTFTVTINGAGADGKTRTTTLTLTIPKQTTYQLTVGVKDQFNAPVKGITVTIDSSSYTTDTSGQVTVQVSQGTHTIAVPSSYLQSSGTRYLFEKWSDGGGVTANPRTVTVNSAVTFTAMEKKQHYLTMQVSPSSSAGTVSPSSDWYDSGKQVTISASASSGYKFDTWSGSGSGSYSGTGNPVTITINAPITETASFQKVYTVSVKTLATYGSLSTSPLSGLKVKIGTATVQTDSNGVASFALPAGTYDISLVDTSVTKSITSVDVRGFVFKWWDNLSTSNPRTINVNGPSTLIAYYPITWQQYTLNPNTYTAEVADPSKTDSLGNPVLRSVSLPYAKSASNWLLGWEWSMDVRTDNKGAHYGAHDYAAWGYTKAFTTKWNSKLTPATHSYAIDKLAISYSGYLNVKGITSDSDQGLYFRYRDTYNNKGDTSPSVDWTNTKSYNGVVGAARVFTPKQVIVGDLLVSTYQWTRGSNFDLRFGNGYGWTTNNMVATLYFTSTNP
ncbi:InlB B-repeat-containing protein [Candidatus Nitrososphaera gargensis]|uniref:InlB B-repeat-containing protein n=1 Tax=Candidatus Nitrososphaera gargensis TaxID=497727 RepID=UPI000ACA72C1|nr:archaellin/type IV pilin N-terminal domain-containing protein [Candidatus Nitrososphaera gargensis]